MNHPLEFSRFLAVQALGLGAVAFIAWSLLVSPGVWTRLPALDVLAALAVGVVLTALFILLVGLPVQSLLPGTASLPVRLLTGLFSGPLGVWLGLLVFSKYPLGSHWYFDRAWHFHLVYAGAGLCFARAWHRRGAASSGR
jgi:hypothetical protein